MSKNLPFIVVVIVVLVISIVLVSGGKKDLANSDTPIKVTTTVGATDYLKEADTAYSEGDMVVAKKFYKKAMEEVTDSKKLQQLQDKISKINTRLIFSPTIDSCSVKYVVKPNDALIKIAKKYGTTVNLIKKANKLKSNIIKPGQELKINRCKFSVVVDKSQNVLILKHDDEIVKTYSVATGADNSTPTGNFKVITKLVDPTWFRMGAVVPPESPENILGTRWIGIDIKGYGIHGTTIPESIGQQVTLGCVRMRNKEVEELYDIIPLGTEVVIVD